VLLYNFWYFQRADRPTESTLPGEPGEAEKAGTAKGKTSALESEISASKTKYLRPRGEVEKAWTAEGKTLALEGEILACKTKNIYVLE
jgi:hypothetical protein